MWSKRQWGAGPAVAAGLAALTLAAAPAAWARQYLPPTNHIFAGVTGVTSIIPFWRMVGKHPPVLEDWMTYNTPTRWISGRDPDFRARLGIELATSRGYARRGLTSPEGIALGASDAFLVRLNRNLAHSRRILYVRIMGEMDAWWNAYSAYNANGTFRGPSNSPHFFIQAWRRTVLILRGGPVARINRRLRALGLPKLGAKALCSAVSGDTPSPCATALARPKVAFLWVPQDAGSPEIAADAPSVYWPGAAYVDWVGTDFYSFDPNFSLLDHFYSQFSGKPFVISEWAVYGADNPSFVRRLFAWVLGHPRVRMINYYQGFTPSSPANLAHYPASRRALARELRSRRFEAYPPEYAHPPGRPKPPPETPPLPPPSASPPPSPSPPSASPPPSPSPPPTASPPSSPSPPPTASPPSSPSSPLCLKPICPALP